ncbi:hypothetical protein [Planctomicrobium piriforme]|uniref:hypothetical protein n=1 Tax=Planctomicrobium piriforme TaxID=1576369 RepID=UPI000B836AE6|nr:hypothetical protein [Planctomicrobium piriforme]
MKALQFGTKAKLIIGGFLLAIALCGAGIAAVFLLLADGRCAEFFSVDHPNAIKTQRLGDHIIGALNRYREERNDFPKSLEELVPDYLETIPPPLYGERKWVYHRIETPGEPPQFELTFGPPNLYPCVFYESKHRTWTVDD